MTRLSAPIRPSARISARTTLLLLGTVGMALAVLSPHARAAEVPLPAPKAAVLSDIDEKLAREKARKSELDSSLAAQNKDSERLQDKLVDIAGKVQSREKQSMDLQDKVRKLNKQQTALMENLQKERIFLQQAVNGYLQMRLAPPAVWAASPVQTREVGLGMTALHAVMPHLHRDVERLQSTMRDLDDTQDNLRKKQAELIMATSSLTQQRQAMQLLLKERDRQRNEMQAALSAQEETISSLSNEAQDLKDLIKRLEAKNRKLRDQQEQEHAARIAKSAPVPDAPPQGLRRLAASAMNSLGTVLPDNKEFSGTIPVAGKITVNYGESDALGATAQGMHIRGLPGGSVTAPAGGTVRYTGTFQNYGKIVLIEHRKGYHSLVAGLDKIATVVGSHVKAGEPIGTLQSGNTAPTAYFELRHNGEPVNPATHLAALR